MSKHMTSSPEPVKHCGCNLNCTAKTGRSFCSSELLGKLHETTITVTYLYKFAVGCIESVTMRLEAEGIWQGGLRSTLCEDLTDLPLGS